MLESEASAPHRIVLDLSDNFHSVVEKGILLLNDIDWLIGHENSLSAPPNPPESDPWYRVSEMV